MTFNEKLLFLRKKAGLSQEELAEKLDVSRQAVSRWETGETLPDAKNILMLSDIFRVSADTLLRDEAELPQPPAKPAEAPVPQAQRSPVLYEILCVLPLVLVCVAADSSFAAMTVCFLSTLLMDSTRVFTVKTVPFSRLEKSMRDRIFLSYILCSAFLFSCAAAVYFAAPASGASNRAVLLTLFMQIHLAVHAETFIYFPGDKSPVLRAFRKKFYSIFPYFSAFAVSALAARISAFFGSDETAVLCITFAVLLALCGALTLVLKRKEEREDAE